MTVYSTARKAALLLLALIGLAATQPAAAQLTGIRYTVAPRADRVLFDDNAVLADASMLSGRVGFGFGEYLEFSAVGRYAPNAQTDFSSFSDLGDPTTFLFDQLPSRDLQYLQYGADLKVNFAPARGMVPYVSIGTGILSLDPDGLDRTETIYLGASVGLLYRWQDRFTFTIEAQRQQWRMNAASLMSDTDLTDVALAREDFRTIGVGAYAIGAGISFDLGGRAQGEMTDLDRALSGQFSRGFSAVRLEIEPFYGSVDFAPALGYQNTQRMAGVGAGVDLGPFVGIRGFYWRGLEDGNAVRFESLQAYGGELIMRFGTPNRLIRPHLSVGGGYLDARDGYVGNGTGALDDRPFAMAAAGASIKAGRYFSLQGGVRSLLASAESTENVSSPTSVETSWMYFGGISFELGRGGITGSRRPTASEVATEPAPRAGQAPSPMDLEIAALRAEVERQRRLVAQLTAAAANAGQVPVAPDSMLVDSMMVPAPVLPAKSAVGSEAKPRWMTVPIPEEGEIYIRFGAPTAQPEDAVYYLDTVTGQLTPAALGRGLVNDSTASGLAGMTAAQVRALIDQAVREASTTGSTPAAAAKPNSELSAFEARMEARFNELDRKLRAKEEADQDVKAEGAAQMEGERAIEVKVEGAKRPPLKVRGLLPVTGYNLNSPRTVLLGGRVELARESSAYSILTDFILGFGSKTTWSASVNAVTDFALPRVEDARVYLGPGIGFLADGDTQLVLNLLVGANYPLGIGKVFGEYQTQDLFNNNRILVGYRLGL